MFTLKRFGVMGLSWKPRKHESGASLKRTLFLQPLGSIVGIFLLIFALFNLLFRFFIDEEVNKAIQTTYDRLDAYYVGEGEPKVNSESLFTATYVIVNAAYETLYLSASQDELSQADISDEVVTYFYDHDEEWEFLDEFDVEEEDDEEEETVSVVGRTRFTTIPIAKNEYSVKIREYRGSFNNFYVQQNKKTQETYYILVFVNTSPMRDFSRIINGLLLVLLIGFGWVASMSIYLTNKKIDKDLEVLKLVLSQVTKEAKKVEFYPLSFGEFQKVKQAVEQMQTRLLASEESQQLFFQNASHELRTPLMSIQGYAEGLEAGVLPDQKAALSIIQLETQKMKRLVDDILQLAKIEDLHTELSLEMVSVKELLLEQADLFSAQAKANHLSFEYSFQHETNSLQLDELLIERALSNIFSNALRYATSTIFIQTREGSETFEIEIANDGAMIAEEKLPHIFERFYKGTNGNFGLGLAIAKEVVSRHGGKLTAYSNLDRTGFVLTFMKN